MNRKIFRSIGLLVLTLLLLTTAAFATSSLSAHCILPPIEGTATSEDSGIKEVDGSNAYLYDVTVGGGYEVNCRQYCTSNNVTGPWTKGISSVKDAAHLGGATRIFAGNEVRLQFSTHFLTPVRVEVNGTWDSN